jgi:uncharacterized membrane protein YdjX (TVP38/TMEM64 family)
MLRDALTNDHRPASEWPRILFALAVGGVLLTAVHLFPVDRWALALVAWIRAAGSGGLAIFAVGYIAAAVLFLPGSILTLGAGFAYGPIFGLLIVSPVSVLAATAAFALGRSIARPWVSRKVSGDPRFAAIDRAVGENGFKIVFLLRLSPLLPFNLLNYTLGLTRVRLRDYVAASFLGMLPGTLLYVYLGSLVTSASELVGGHTEGGVWRGVLYAAGLVATFVATVAVTRIARRALAEVLDGKSATSLGPVSP